MAKYIKLTLIIIFAWAITLPLYSFVERYLGLSAETSTYMPIVVLFAALAPTIFGELYTSKNEKEYKLAKNISKVAVILIDIFFVLAAILLIYIIFFAK